MSYTSSWSITNWHNSLWTHIGKVLFSPDFLLDNVFYIPSFKFNLLLVSQLTKSIKFNLLLVSQLTKSNRYYVIFSFNSCEFQDMYTKKKIGKGKLHDDPFLHTISSPIWLQHMRLILGIGHLATLLLAI